MTIELCSPAPKWSADRFHVRPNRCDCHPETCGCNPWVVHGPDGQRHSSYYAKETADSIAELLQLKTAMVAEFDALRGTMPASATPSAT